MISPSEEALRHRRATFVQGFGMIAAAGSLVAAGIAVVSEQVDLVPLFLVLGVLELLGAALARRGLARAAAAWMTVVLWVGTSLGVIQGGLAGPSAASVVLLPVFGAIAGGTRLGLVGLALAVLTAAGLGTGLVIPVQPLVARTALARSLTGGTLVALVGLSAIFLAVLTDRLTRQLDRSRSASQDADRAKSRLLANCSHDLRTPLNAVLGYTDLLREDAIEEGRHAAVEDLDQIERSARGLLGRVNRVLELARLEAGRVTVEPREVRLADLLRPGAHTVEISAETLAFADPDIVRQLVEVLIESVGAGGGPVRLHARLLRPGWLHLMARAPGDGPLEDLSGMVVERLVEHLGGRSGVVADGRWLEIPVAP